MVRKPKYGIGDEVTSNVPAPRGLALPGVFTITRVMPLNGADYEYRARSSIDGHERVFRETEVRPR